MRRLLGPILTTLWILFGLTACGESDTTALGFVLVRADALERPGALRDTGLDRDNVAEVICEVLDANGAAISGDRETLDPATAPGEQELRLRRVPAGSGYFARIRGLSADADLWECGATGPFELRRGAKAMVTIVIDRPDEVDPGCELICRGHDDCPASAYCPSPCVRNQAAAECTDALCRKDYIGQACTFGECGPGFTCLDELAGWPAGYCSAACVTDANCPGRSLCATVVDQRRCVRLCDQNEDCRAADGYSCDDVGDGRTACLP